MTCSECRSLISTDPAIATRATCIAFVRHLRSCPNCEEFVCKYASLQKPLTTTEVDKVEKLIADDLRPE